jgi:hypothetical protein
VETGGLLADLLVPRLGARRRWLTGEIGLLNLLQAARCPARMGSLATRPRSRGPRFCWAIRNANITVGRAPIDTARGRIPPHGQPARRSVVSPTRFRGTQPLLRQRGSTPISSARHAHPVALQRTSNQSQRKRLPSSIRLPTAWTALSQLHPELAPSVKRCAAAEAPSHRRPTRNFSKSLVEYPHHGRTSELQRSASAHV